MVKEGCGRGERGVKQGCRSDERGVRGGLGLGCVKEVGWLLCGGVATCVRRVP